MSVTLKLGDFGRTERSTYVFCHPLPPKRCWWFLSGARKASSRKSATWRTRRGARQCHSTAVVRPQAQPRTRCCRIGLARGGRRRRGTAGQPHSGTKSRGAGKTGEGPDAKPVHVCAGNRRPFEQGHRSAPDPTRATASRIRSTKPGLIHSAPGALARWGQAAP